MIPAGRRFTSFRTTLFKAINASNEAGLPFEIETEEEDAEFGDQEIEIGENGDAQAHSIFEHQAKFRFRLAILIALDGPEPT